MRYNWYWDHTADPVTYTHTLPNPTPLSPEMWHSRQLGRYVCVSQAFTCVFDMGKGKKKKSVEWGITTLVCESQRALSLICNQNLVSRPGSVSSLTSSSTAMSRPWQWCLVGFFVQRIDSPARKYSNQGWWLLAYWLTVCTESPREAEWADVL